MTAQLGVLIINQSGCKDKRLHKTTVALIDTYLLCLFNSSVQHAELRMRMRVPFDERKVNPLGKQVISDNNKD